MIPISIYVQECKKCGTWMSYEKCAGMVVLYCHKCGNNFKVKDTWKESEKDGNTLTEGSERSCFKKLTPTGRRPTSAPPSPNAPHWRKK